LICKGLDETSASLVAFADEDRERASARQSLIEVSEFILTTALSRTREILPISKKIRSAQ
jgi:hypothetical protein